MKRCPKCNRTYSTDTQKFCTHDGGLLFMIDEGLGETVQFDSSKVQDEVAKPTTRDLGEQQPAFDPEATVVSTVEDGTQQIKRRDTVSLEPSQPTQHQMVPPAGAPSGPIQPPPTSAPPPPPTEFATSAPLPPPEITPSGPIPPSAPLPPPHAPASQRLTPAAKKKSKLPLVLAIVAVIVIFFVGAAAVAAYFLVIKPRQEARRVVEPATRSEPTRPSVTTTATPTEVSKPANEPPPYNAPADAIQFVNSKDNLDGRLLEHYVDFSFYYPSAWVKDPTAGVSGASNFAKVERRIPPDFTQENFAVGWYSSAGSAEADASVFHTLVENLSSQFKKSFPEYKKVSEGDTNVGVYKGYEFRFESVSRNTVNGDVNVWGRVVLLPPPNGGNNGVTLLMLTTSLAPELKSVNDVGEKGDLPMLLQSFRFGK